MQITKINDSFSVAPQIGYGHVETLAAQGYKAIVNHRPDGEENGQPLSKALAKAAKKSGIAYHYIPFKPGRATAADKEKFQQILAQTDGPVLGFCRSGMRARSLYKACNKGSGGGFFARLFGR